MSWTQSAYNAFKKLVVLDARLSELATGIESMSQKLDSATERLTNRLDNHAERLARLEGKFELLETSLSSRRRRLPE